MKAIGLYIHIPWCIKKCPYCDFNSHELKSSAPESKYIEALINDLREDLKLLDEDCSVSSIFIGGGTPSIFSPEAFDQLLAGISSLIPLKESLEITLEANPGTFESIKFSEFRALGINRLSIGIQSFNNHHLKKLGRIHSAEEALAAVECAFQAGFQNINLDLMFGLPDQTNEEMLKDVKTAINLQPSHISFYQLTLEPNTYFHKFPPRLPEDDKIICGQIKSQELLAKSGYIQYEISAYSKYNNICQHNVNYWQFGDYIGIGAGAHGKISKPGHIVRTSKLKNPERYLENSTAKITRVMPQELPLEFLMNQLRLKTGFSSDHYQLSTGMDIMTLEPTLSYCVNEGLLIKKGNQYSCSYQGWNYLDSILEKFIS